MKNIVFNILIYGLILTSICCKVDVNNKSKKTPIKVINNIIADTIKESIDLNCISKSDSLEIIAFTTEFIEDMKRKDYNSIFNKMKNPEDERKIIDEMSKDFPDFLNAIFYY